MGYLPSVLLPFLAQTCKSSMELLSTCPQLVSIQSSHISMRAMAPQWQALSCLVPLSLEPKTSRPNQTKIPKTYRKCLQRRHTILHLLLFYCFTCCWDSSIFIYTINSDWRGTLALMWSCIGVSTLFFHELFTGIQWCVMKYSDYLNHSSWEWQRYLLICLLKSRTCHSAQSVFLVQNASLPFCLPFPAMHTGKNLHGKCCLLLFLFGMYSFISAGPGAEASFWLDKHCASPSKIKVSRLILCLEPMRVFTQLCLDM